MSETLQPTSPVERLDLWALVDALAVGAAAKLGRPSPRAGVEAPSERFRRVSQCLALRVEAISIDDESSSLLEQVACDQARLCFIAKSANDRSRGAYAAKLASIKRHPSAPSAHGLVFLEVSPDACSPTGTPSATVAHEHGYTVLRARGKSVPTTMAAVLMSVGTELGIRPEIYLDWSERNPLLAIVDYLTTGHGDIAPVLREILRRAQPNASLRPRVRVA